MKRNDTFSLIAHARGAANDYLTRQLNSHGITGLVPTHGGILWALGRNGQMTMRELAEEIRRNKSTVTALVSKLEVQGYVERFPSGEDSRVTLVRLSEKGEDLRSIFGTISDTLMETGLKGISEEELESFRETLKRIITNFD
jgi:DNA-binding MarR family transcriptional regulator